MIFYKDNRTIQFVHIPKTGGTSIRKLIQFGGWKKDEKRFFTKEAHYLKSHPHHTKDVYNKMNSDLDVEFTFTIVRNPIERMLSEIFYVIKGYEKLETTTVTRNSITPHGIIHYMYAVFTDLIPKLGIGFDDNHWVPQHCFVDDKTKVFKFEEIENVVNFLSGKDVIVDQKLPHMNKSRIDKVIQPDWDYAPDVTKYFYKLYQKDFELFNYPVPELILKHVR